MLELVHDMAPGAQLYFATAFINITSFANNIRALRAAGCDIIVDDVGYFVESPFQDGQAPSVVSPTNGGVVTQAVKDVAASGALYFSSAGNAGNLDDGTAGVWEGDFTAGAASGAPVTTAGTLHRFSGVQDYDVMTVAGSSQINLFWTDPLGASGNDYDLFKLDPTGAAVLAGSTSIQDGNDDPFELVANGTNNARLVIVKKNTAAARFLHLNTNRGRLSLATAGQIRGHAATSHANTFAVAATNAQVPVFPYPFSTANPVETFSSDGPRRYFFNADGTTAGAAGNFSSTGGLVLQKPDLTAADGVSVSNAGHFGTIFFGTSAAAPNAAAIMALFKSQNPSFTPAQLRTLLISTALDIEGPGVDRDSGAGIVMAMPPQPGCSISSPSFSIAPLASGGPLTIGVTASSPSCNWTVYSSVPWMTFTNRFGVGSGSFIVNTARNDGPGRGASITLVGQTQWSIPVTQSGVGAGTTFVNNTVTPIPDVTTTDIPIVVSGLTQPISNVTLSVYLTHTFDSDLTISLVAPDGTVVELAEGNGGSGNDYGTTCSPTSQRTTFDDSAITPIQRGTTPFTGSFRPSEPLARFNGKSPFWANGIWKLRIADVAPPDSGTFQCASLVINQGPLRHLVNDFDGNGSDNFTVFRPSSGQWFINGLGTVSFGLPGDIPVPGDYDADGDADFTVYRPSTGQWFRPAAATVQYGRSGDIPVPADYDGDGATDIAVYRTTDGLVGVWRLNLPAQPPVAFGLRGDIPMPGDYDGDGRADLAVFRPSTGQWFIASAVSGFASVTTASFGLPGDIPVSGDVDDDGRLDLLVFRPSNGTWYGLPSNVAPFTVSFGLAGDIPATLDIDGDGFAEFCVWRPSTGQWFARSLLSGTTTTMAFGLAGDIPAPARPRLPSAPVSDFDGDGVSDVTVFRPSTGEWFTRTSSSGFAAIVTTPFGLSGDIRVNGDYDGDRRTDRAVFRPSTNQWFILQSSNGAVRTVSWGLGGDVPTPADFDGDGRTDIAVWRPSSGEWFVINSSSGALAYTPWGLPGDQPIARDFDGDGRADLAVYRPSSFQWFIKTTTAAFGPQIIRTWGLSGDLPMPADFDGDGRTEIAIYRPTTGVWAGIDAITGALVVNAAWGLPGDTAQPHDFDGDGRDDLAVFRPSSGTWFINKSSTGALLMISWGLSTDQPVLRTSGRER
jgi:subtilisin-like proprotein convertase family protein